LPYLRSSKNIDLVLQILQVSVNCLDLLRRNIRKSGDVYSSRRENNVRKLLKYLSPVSRWTEVIWDRWKDKCGR
jgi:hypothetical protein